MRTTTITGALGLALAATALVGCGPSHSGAGRAADGYCRELRTDKAYFLSLDSDRPDLTRLDDMFGRLHSLAADAPAGVATDWKTVDTAVTTIEGALTDAGLKPDDLAEMQKGKVPAGVDLDKLATLAPQMAALSGHEVNDAANRIARDAKASCGFDLQAG
jgi:hypothetical protein